MPDLKNQLSVPRPASSHEDVFPHDIFLNEKFGTSFLSRKMRVLFQWESTPYDVSPRFSWNDDLGKTHWDFSRICRSFQGMVSGKGQCRGTTAGKGTTILAATIGRFGSVWEEVEANRHWTWFIISMNWMNVHKFCFHSFLVLFFHMLLLHMLHMFDYWWWFWWFLFGWVSPSPRLKRLKNSWLQRGVCLHRIVTRPHSLRISGCCVLVGNLEKQNLHFHLENPERVVTDHPKFYVCINMFPHNFFRTWTLSVDSSGVLRLARPFATSCFCEKFMLCIFLIIEVFSVRCTY